jgi:hypothetical protein
MTMPKPRRKSVPLSRAQERAILALCRQDGADRSYECSEVRPVTWESLERQGMVRSLPGYLPIWLLTQTGAAVGAELVALERERAAKPVSRWADAARRFLRGRNRKGITRLDALRTCADLLRRLRSGSRRRRYKQLRKKLRDLQDRLTRSL